MSKKIIISVFIISFLNCLSQENTLVSVIRKADQQRLLCEKMTKNYLLIGAKINVVDAKIELKENINTFDTNLKNIMLYLKMDDTKLFKPEVKDLWENFREKIQEKNAIKNASEIMITSNELSISCMELAKYIKSDSEYKTNSLENLCNKQLLNLQKIMKLCTASIWNIDYPNLDKELKESIVSFDFSIYRLIQETKKNSKLRSEIETQNQIWMCTKEKIEEDKANFLQKNVFFDLEKTNSNFKIILEYIENDKKQVATND
jgi:hypothetical protein